MPAEPRFLIIDLHKNKAVPATTEEMQAILRRVEPLTGEAYFQRVENIHDPKTSEAEHSVSSL